MVFAWGNTGQLGMGFAWVDKCVDLCWTFGPTFISRVCATNIQHGPWSIVQMCEYLRFTTEVICSLLHTWRDGDPMPPQMRMILMNKLDRDTAKNIAEIMTTYMVWDSIASDALDDPEKTSDDYRR